MSTTGPRSGGDAGNAAGAGAQRTNIEFKVKPREDLFLEGPIRSLPRVSCGDEYLCQMHKQQQFSCLFRHYAKHNGLKKDDLVFYFVDELKADETPESVHLMANDEIWVERRKHEVEEDDSTRDLNSGIVYDQFRRLLPEGDLAGEHSDVTFFISEDGSELFGHRTILAVRSEYFRAMLKKDGMIESQKSIIEVRNYSNATFSRMLEFIYTNTIRDFEETTSADVRDLLTLANEYLLNELREFCEIRAQQCVNRDNICEFYLLSVTHNATVLQRACKEFVSANLEELSRYQHFRDEMGEHPELGLLLLDLRNEKSDEKLHPHKRRKGSSNPIVSTTVINSVEAAPGIETSNAIIASGTADGVSGEN